MPAILWIVPDGSQAGMRLPQHRPGLECVIRVKSMGSATRDGQLCLAFTVLWILRIIDAIVSNVGQW